MDQLTLHNTQSRLPLPLTIIILPHLRVALHIHQRPITTPQNAISMPIPQAAPNSILIIPIFPLPTPAPPNPPPKQTNPQNSKKKKTHPFPNPNK